MGALVCAHRICMVANPHACDDGVSAEEVACNLLIQTDDAAIFSAIQDVRPKVNGALKNVYHIRFGACATAMGGATRTCRPTLYTRAQHKTLHTHTHTSLHFRYGNAMDLQIHRKHHDEHSLRAQDMHHHTPAIEVYYTIYSMIND